MSDPPAGIQWGWGDEEPHLFHHARMPSSLTAPHGVSSRLYKAGFAIRLLALYGLLAPGNFLLCLADFTHLLNVMMTPPWGVVGIKRDNGSYFVHPSAPELFYRTAVLFSYFFLCGHTRLLGTRSFSTMHTALPQRPAPAAPQSGILPNLFLPQDSPAHTGRGATSIPAMQVLPG